MKWWAIADRKSRFWQISREAHCLSSGWRYLCFSGQDPHMRPFCILLRLFNITAVLLPFLWQLPRFWLPQIMPQICKHKHWDRWGSYIPFPGTYLWGCDRFEWGWHWRWSWLFQDDSLPLWGERGWTDQIDFDAVLGWGHSNRIFWGCGRRWAMRQDHNLLTCFWYQIERIYWD